jgi:hypothetical protein
MTDLTRFEVARGNAGHPDYWAEEQDAADIIRDKRRDRRHNPCECPRGFVFDVDAVKFMGKTHDAGGVALVAVRCLHCPGCLAYLDERDVVCAASHFRRSLNAGLPLWRLACANDADWKALYMRLYRAGADYQSFPDGAGGRVVFTNAESPPYASPVTLEAALEEIRQLLAANFRNNSKVKRSHGWKLPDLRVNNPRLSNPQETDDSPCAETIERIAVVEQVDVELVTPSRADWTQKYWEFKKRGGLSTEARLRLRRSLQMGEPLGNDDWVADYLETGIPMAADDQPSDLTADLNLTGSDAQQSGCKNLLNRENGSKDSYANSERGEDYDRPHVCEISTSAQPTPATP